MTFQNTGLEPGILMGFRTHNDLIPDGERAFILASTRVALEDGDTPVKIRNLVKKTNEGGSK